MHWLSSTIASQTSDVEEFTIILQLVLSVVVVLCLKKKMSLQTSLTHFLLFTRLFFICLRFLLILSAFFTVILSFCRQSIESFFDFLSFSIFCMFRIFSRLLLAFLFHFTHNASFLTHSHWRLLFFSSRSHFFIFFSMTFLPFFPKLQKVNLEGNW